MKQNLLLRVNKNPPILEYKRYLIIEEELVKLN